MIIQLPKNDIKEGDIIVKLCQQVKKIDVLERKINFLFSCVGKTEKDFEVYDTLSNVWKKINIENSKIISGSDFGLVSIGINQVLKKSLANAKLLYRGTRDGDNSKNFHSKWQEIWSFYKSWKKLKF